MANPGSARRGVPDLLFEEVRDARVALLKPHLEVVPGARPDLPLHRVTVFLTYGCNLRCPYCKTIARTAAERRADPRKQQVFTPTRFEGLLDAFAGRAIEHLHLTGGEAALVPGVVEMVAMAKRRGIAHLSMTSNGTAPPSRYVALVEAGLTELRLSLDARDPEAGARLTGRKEAWAKAVESFLLVAATRDAGADVRLIANAVVGRANREGVVELVRFLLSLGPDDVKLITEVDARDELADFPALPTVMAGLRALLATYPPHALPLLRRKVGTVFAADAIGLEAQAPGAARPDRCYVPLTERTVDGVGVYPCSVYLREGGAPLARLSDPPEVQEAQTQAWVRTHACRSDALCLRYCLHCTRGFNEAANRERGPG